MHQHWGIAVTKLNKTSFVLRLRRGLAIMLATAFGDEGEPAYTTDTKQVYICDGTNFLHVPTMNVSNQYASDFEFSATGLGPILVDRSTGAKYRISVDNGVLGVEAV